MAHWYPDHIRKNRPALAVRSGDLSELTDRRGMAFLADHAYRYRITVVAPIALLRYGAVCMWDKLRGALTDYYDGDALRARTLLVELGLKPEPELGCSLFAHLTNGVWEIRHHE